MHTTRLLTHALAAAAFATLSRGAAAQISAANGDGATKVGTSGDGKAACGTSGSIVEHTVRPANVQIRLTDANRNFIEVREVQTHHIPGLNGAFSQAWNVPAGYLGGIVCDAHNYVVALPPGGDPLPPPNPNPPLQPPVPNPGGGAGGPASLLYIESFVFDTVTQRIELEGIFDRIRRTPGLGPVVQLPDLFADTNGDGVIGDGDALYSLVDFDIYLRAVPSFDFDDTFTIVNGRVAGLPGMIFSTTPFSYDPTLLASAFGTVDDGVPGFAGTPADGTATLLAIHEVSSIPEPPARPLLACGLAALAALGRAGTRRRYA